MRKLSVAAVAVGLFALAACGGTKQDTLNEADLNQTQDLNELAEDAANIASEAEALENHAEQLNQEAQAADNASGAETAADENIQGM